VKIVSEEQLSKAVGASISRVRVQCGMTQDQVAEALEIGPEAVSRMERGIVTPSLVRLVQFAELFKCPVETFFNKSTGLRDDNANAIAQLLEKLNRADRQFVLEIVEKTCEYLKKKSR
jgi:transcriptional regulator with XRE-family HTH domain